MRCASLTFLNIEAFFHRALEFRGKVGQPAASFSWVHRAAVCFHSYVGRW